MTQARQNGVRPVVVKKFLGVRPVVGTNLTQAGQNGVRPVEVKKFL